MLFWGEIIMQWYNFKIFFRTTEPQQNLVQNIIGISGFNFIHMKDHPFFQSDIIMKLQKFINLFLKNHQANFNPSWHNLTKVRPLFTLSHRGFINSPLMIVFKNFAFAYCVLILTNQINAVQYFWRWRKSFSTHMFSCHLWHVVYSDHKVKASKILSVA